MFKHIKVVTALIMVLAIFAVLQLASSGLFFNALKGIGKVLFCRRRSSANRLTSTPHGWR